MLKIPPGVCGAFICHLLAPVLVLPVAAEQVLFSEVMYHPAGSAPEFVELWNITSTPLDIARWRFTRGIDYTFPDFVAGSPQAHIIRAQERIIVSPLGEAATRAAWPTIPADVRVFGPWTGALDNVGEMIELSDKNGVVACRLDYRDGGNWPKAADGAGHSLVLRNENNRIDDFRNWRVSRFTGGTPGYSEFSAVVPFVGSPEVGVGAAAAMFDYGTTWKWSIPPADPGSSWRAVGFNDADWGSGPGLLGFETAGVPAPGMQTAVGSSGQSMVYLFRKSFTFAGSPAGATFAIDQIVDDGVTYYLNGQLIGSSAHSPAAWDNGASRTVGDATEELAAVTGPAAGLVNGANVLAAEVHEANATSSDLVFGARLKISTQSTIVINEVKPGLVGQGFVEFFNTTGTAVDLQDYHLSDDAGNLAKFRLTGSVPVPAHGFATVGFAESGLAVGATTTVYLTAPNGTTAVNAVSAAIPFDGRSLGRQPAGGTSWFLFAHPTPGGANGTVGEAAFSLRLSEVHFGEAGRVDWVELENTAPTPANAAGLLLASTSDFTDALPLGGPVPGLGFASWDSSFATDAGGAVTLYLIDSGHTVLDVVELTRMSGRDSWQAVYPPGVLVKPTWESVPERPWWNSSVTATRDAANAPPLTTSVVINEIMSDPPSNHQNGQFIELHNQSGSPVGLSGWKLRGGADFDFAAGTTLPAGGFLVIGRDVGFLQARAPGAIVVGPWSGRLRSGGDIIRVIDDVGNLVDEVDYRVGGDWPALAAGQGSSLELIHPDMDNSRGSAWRASDEAAKMPWQSYTITGTYTASNSLGAPSDYKELHLFLVGDSQVALRNLSMRQGGAGANLIPGAGTAMSTDGTAVAGWLCQGTHAGSSMENGELHLVADGHGDNRPNRAEIDVTGLTAGQSYTLSFEARWISGKNRLVVQTWDHSFGRPLLLPMPEAAGSAGSANSQRLAAAPPQVDTVLHTPAVPKPTDVVKITARVTSRQPLSAVEVVHRADDINNGNPWVTSPMVDDGTGGDAVANDGLYTAGLTAYQTEGRIVQFFVRATAAGATSELPRGAAERPALWIVDSRTLDNRLRRQRFVISAYDRDRFNANGDQPTAKYGYKYPRLSNHYVNATFISNESDVYYNSEIRKSGSPWTRSSGADLARGKWKVQRDRIFRGREKSTYDNDAEGGARHHNRLARYWLYVLGHPGNENEFVYHVVNTDGLTIREDTEPVDGEMVARCFPGGGDGQLFRSDDEWWFQDDWNRSQRNADWSYKGTDATLRYHTEWMSRSREAEYDYAPLIDFFRTVSNAPNYPAAQYRELVNRMLDPDLTLMMAAVRGYMQDWDSLTLSRGKNGFFYRKPGDGRFMFLHWDSDLAFGDVNGAVVGGLAGWGTYVDQPWARRTFNYYLAEMLRLTSGSGSARTLAWLDAEEAASPSYSVDRAFYQNWFAGRGTAVTTEINRAVGTGGAGAAATAPLAVTTPTGSTAANTLTLTGTAPAAAYTVAIDGHPEAVLTWGNQTKWTLAGIVLQQGGNALTLRWFDAAGVPAGAPVAYSYTKTGNAPPVMRVSADPASFNVALGERITLDASESFDPEGTPLSFGWTSTPLAGGSLSSPVPSQRQGTFSVPGVYALTVTATDGASQAAPLMREVTVFNAEDFDPFSAAVLAPLWTLQGVELRDNYSPSAWYSLEDQAGRLLVQVRDDVAKPLAYTAPIFPALYRPLPAGADFVLQTDFTYDGKRTGASFTGLVADVMESGSLVKYAFCVEGGVNLRVKRSTGGAFDNQGTAVPFTGTSATLRVRRSGTALLFEQRAGDVWSEVHTQSLPTGSAAVRGGPFVATSAAENARIAFDYVLLADPGHVNSQLHNLRLTELMYMPKAPATAEFIELKNVGAGPVSLLGVTFVQGSPFDEFILPDVVLGPGQSGVITNDTLAFRQRYGMEAMVIGEWAAGVLSNNGERVQVLDADGNVIHDFSYGVIAPWPEAPKGQGPSLEVVSTSGDYTLASNWRASAEAEGSPGSTGMGPDGDGDGMADSIETGFGTDPGDPNSVAQLTVTGSGQFSFPSVTGNVYRLQFSEDLDGGSWATLQTITASGSVTTMADPTSPLPPQRFYRALVVLP